MTTEEYKKTLEEAIKGIDEILTEIGNDLFGHGETLEYYRTDPKGIEKWEYYSKDMLSRTKAKHELQDISNKLDKGELWIDKPIESEASTITTENIEKMTRLAKGSTSWFAERMN